ncbi:hypothetical protein QM012_009310 [Aureobasidium pullulans]|uniref:Uncharacterized protein n=1 Tax=Aureobasidium pullulans TaxID=5580 RepID=A0ABR0TGI4_AURPU
MEMQTAVHKALDVKWQLTERIDSHKGRKRSHRRIRQTREYLERYGAISACSTTNIKLTIVPEAYPPSKASILALRNKIYLDDLYMETHHHGRFLILRTFAYPTNFSETQTFMPVEDEHTELPSGAVLCVKEPFYSSVSEDIGMALCVHHPSDVVFLDEDHPLFPHEWKSSAQPNTAFEWKLDGNNALKSRDYIKANQCYTKGLAAPRPAENEIKSDLLRNRAQPPRAFDYATLVLMDQDYKVTMDRTKGIILDRTNCVLSGKAVTATQYIEHFYTRVGKQSLAKSARALAEEMHVTCMGSMVDYKGFEK